MNFDVHVHLDIGSDIDAVVAGAREMDCRLGICACGPLFHSPGNEAAAEVLRKYPDMVVGFGYLELGREDGPWTVEALHQQGFRALKVHIPARDYDDRALYPVYARAEELHMPILFHTGVVARFDLWAKRYGWTDFDLDLFRNYDISSKRMRPILLDAIARAFPDLNIIMAHFCSLGRRGEAAAVLEHNPNVYADLTTLSGATTQEQIVADARLLASQIRQPRTYERLLFGTDLFASWGPERLAVGLKAVNGIIDELDLGEDLRRRIMGETAAEMVGLT